MTVARCERRGGCAACSGRGGDGGADSGLNCDLHARYSATESILAGACDDACSVGDALRERPPPDIWAGICGLGGGGGRGAGRVQCKTSPVASSQKSSATSRQKPCASSASCRTAGPGPKRRSPHWPMRRPKAISPDPSSSTSQRPPEPKSTRPGVLEKDIFRMSGCQATPKAHAERSPRARVARRPGVRSPGAKMRMGPAPAGTARRLAPLCRTRWCSFTSSVV
mmetsp:Transcript_11777/g.26058  ORF Transcript_11777/g.26058 Transcript_11777/m.26058 type:complete len:225 (-) Transcript_11777:327-1001(-)